MAVKETIAFIGLSITGYTLFAKHLAQGNYRLLFVSNSEDQALLPQLFLQHSPKAEIETIECTRDGCWEADMIILADETGPAQELIDRIKEVATRKTVVYLSKNNHELFFNQLEKLKQVMPNSKVIGLFYKPTTLETAILGEDKEAISDVSNLLESVGYKRTEDSSKKEFVYTHSIHTK